MILSNLFAAFTLLASVAAAPSGGLETLSERLNSRQDISLTEEGTHGGYFYSWWSDGASPATYTNQAGGRYTVTWQAGGNLVGGKGWNPGTGRTITYTANWRPVNNGNSYLTIYGWTRNPLIEYYVVEAHGEYNPGSAGTNKGSATIGGASYQIYESTRYNAPSIDGTQTFKQFWAIRDQQRQSGSVNMQEVFSAWSSKGMQLGSNHYYQIMATEAYRSAGTSDVTVS